MQELIKNIGLKQKILLIVMLSTALVLSITIMFFSFNVRKNTIADSKKIADSETQKYALQIKSNLDKVFETTSSLSKAFMETRQLDSSIRNKITKGILINEVSSNEDYLSLFLSWEIKALDKTYNKKNGRIRRIAL